MNQIDIGFGVSDPTQSSMRLNQMEAISGSYLYEPNIRQSREVENFWDCTSTDMMGGGFSASLSHEKFSSYQTFDSSARDPFRQSIPPLSSDDGS